MPGSRAGRGVLMPTAPSTPSPAFSSPARYLRHRLRDGAAAALWALGRIRPARGAPRRLTVVTLHRILPAELLARYPLPTLAMTPERLAELLRFLTAHHRCLTLSEALEAWGQGGKEERPLLCLTFDDGQLDNHRHARPVLARFGVPATFFVPSGFVGSSEPLWHDAIAYAVDRIARDAPDPRARLHELLGREPGVAGEALAPAVVGLAKSLAPAAREALVARLQAAAGGPSRPAWDGLMGWDELHGLRADGHEIGCHSRSHELLRGVGADVLAGEVAGARGELEEGLGAPVRTFCYPNGDFDEATLAAVQAAGFSCAVTTRIGVNTPETDPYQLSRVDLPMTHTEDRRGRFSGPVVAWRLTGRFPVAA